VRLLVPGGAGFIGSNFVRYALERWPEVELVVLDKLTYAGNLQNLEQVWEDPRLHFIQGDIGVPETVREAMAGCSHVVNFAAETHVDRSILDPDAFLRTDVLGTRVLLEQAKAQGVERYLQVSTDEVYGDVEAPRRSTERDPLRPRSPYSAAKAGGDLMVQAYHTTYGLPTLITRGSNTYGPYQYPEKLIPLFITNALEGQPLPVYGDGQQMRDWLYVDDHCSGIAAVLERGQVGEVYNVGAGNERPNMEVIERIVALTGCDPALIRHVPDRPGHDRRYALDTSKLRALGWEPEITWERGLEETVRWYESRRDWWEPIKSGAFREYYQEQYARRLAASTPVLSSGQPVSSSGQPVSSS
jgi:dTDP-glucose 4,6-dehydratase